jgi:hypothetical protein
LFSFFYRKSSESQKIEKSEVDGLISNVAIMLGYPKGVIDWNNKSGIHNSISPTLVFPVSTGDFSMGGGSQ